MVYTLLVCLFFLVPCLLSCGVVPLARHLHVGVYECGQCYFLHYGSHQYVTVFILEQVPAGSMLEASKY